MVDKGFSERLNIACDGHPHVPAYGQGRQSWIKESIGVSHEAVSKWFSGAARPRPTMMKALSNALEVDEAWLALGITPQMDPADRRVRNTQAEGATNAFMGLVQLNGARVSLPDDKDPRAEFVDFYAVFRGQQVPFHVSLANEIAEGTFTLTIPKEFDQCTVIGAVHARSMRLHCLKLTVPRIDKHKIRKGGYFEIIMTRRGSEYFTGDDQWQRIHNFNEF